MPTIKEAAAEFLESKRVAVTGVSREPKGHGGNVVYQRLRDRGYEVFAVNPNADEVEGDPCFHDLASIPGRRGGGGDRHEAGDRGRDDARVRRARDRARVDAPRPGRGERVAHGGRVRASTASP